MEGVFPAGDLNGDGVDDMITWSGLYQSGPRRDGIENYNDVGSLQLNRGDRSTGLVNVHYGKLGTSASPVR